MSTLSDEQAEQVARASLEKARQMVQPLLPLLTSFAETDELSEKTRQVVQSLLPLLSFFAETGELSDEHLMQGVLECPRCGADWTKMSTDEWNLESAPERVARRQALIDGLQDNVTDWGKAMHRAMMDAMRDDAFVYEPEESCDCGLQDDIELQDEDDAFFYDPAEEWGTSDHYYRGLDKPSGDDEWWLSSEEEDGDE